MLKEFIDHQTWKHGQHKKRKPLSKCLFVCLYCQIPGVVRGDEESRPTFCQRSRIRLWATAEKLSEAVIANWPHYSLIDLCCANPRVFQAGQEENAIFLESQVSDLKINASSRFPEAKLWPRSHSLWCCLWAEHSAVLEKYKVMLSF